jgi:ribosomal protein L15
MKGQNARAGHKKRPEWRDIIKRIPKLRGFGKNRSRTVDASSPTITAISLSRVEAAFAANDTVSPATLVAKGVVTARGAKIPKIKLIGTTLTKTITVENCAVTAGARAAIEKNGGTIK